VGCGAGYYTFKFANLVGERGRVYAIDTNAAVLDYLMKSAQGYRVPIVPILTRDNDTRLPPRSCDLVFLCTLYHAVYVTDIEYVKDQFIASIKQALKPGGRLVVADNPMLPATQNPFYGPRISRELIVSQLKHYGFKLVDSAQFIPQRYILVFELER
jgi:predicted methyltransferase